jgi:thymidylate synthase
MTIKSEPCFSLTSQYMRLVKEVLERGNNTIGRNGLVRKLWSPAPLRVNSVANNFPLLQNRPTAFYKSCLETFFFLSGDSSYEAMPEVLRTSWWKPWASQAEAQGSWGRFYGTQWRKQVTDTPGVYFDPLQHLLGQLKEVLRTGVENRKMVVSLWHTPDTLSTYAQEPAVLESCLPAHTRVLTKAGWKSITEIVIGEEVWSSDSEFKGVWATVLKTHAFKDKEIAVYSNSNWKIEATEDHRWFGMNQSFKPGFRTSMEIAGKPFKIPTRLKPKNFPAQSVLTQDETRLLGWLLSDGNWEKVYSSGTIKQVKPRYIRVIDKLLSRLQVSYSWSEKFKTFYIPAKVIKPLFEKAFGYVPLKTECSVKDLLHKLGKKELSSLLITLIQAEGSIKPGGTYCIYQSVKSPIADDINALMVLTGIGCTTVAKPPRPQAFGIENCNIYTPRTSKFFNLPPKTFHYQDDVYCLTTTTGTFLVEQNNKTFLSGNCHSTSLVFDLEREQGSHWKLNLHHTQRSLDLVNGTAADLVYSGLLMELICELLNDEEPSHWVEPGTLVFAPVNTHIYENHLEGITQHAHQWESCQKDFEEQKPVLVFPYVGISILRSIINGAKFHSIAEVKEFISINHGNPAGGIKRNPVPFKFTLNA